MVVAYGGLRQEQPLEVREGGTVARYEGTPEAVVVGGVVAARASISRLNGPGVAQYPPEG